MALQDMHDANPERRNLMLLSAAIILYYIAGGEMISNEVRLHLINVRFTKPDVIRLVLWAALIWFLWRYWLTNRGKFSADFVSEIKSLSNSNIMLMYAGHKHGLAYNEDGGFNAVSSDYNITDKRCDLAPLW